MSDGRFCGMGLEAPVTGVLLIVSVVVCWLVCGNMAFRWWELGEGGDGSDAFGWFVAIYGPLAWPMGWVVYRVMT